MNRALNTAAVLLASRRIEVCSQALGDPLSAGEVLVEITYAGVCGTDVAIYRGDYAVPLPLILGHEFSGRIADAPVNSPLNKEIGAPVVCEINNSCVAYGRSELCAACERGIPTHCLTRTVTGIINHPGAFAEYLRVPQGNVHLLPKEFPLESAIFVEPLAAAIRTFELSPIHGGEAVVVLGCGRLGRLIALVAYKAGARVIGVGRSNAHLDLIREFTSHTLPASSEEDLCSNIKDLTAGLGADIVVEATGRNENLALAQRLVRPLGTVAVKSTSGLPVRALDTTKTAVDEIRIQGSRCGPFDKAIKFMQEYGLPNRDWITARFPLANTQDAIEAAATEPKVLINVKSPNLR